MKTIQVEELEQLKLEWIQVVDLRGGRIQEEVFPRGIKICRYDFDSRYEEVLKETKFSHIIMRKSKVILKQRQKPDTMLLM